MRELNKNFKGVEFIMSESYMTVKEAAFALIEYYETSGARNGSFTNSFIQTLEKADYDNRRRLVNSFPEFFLPLQILEVHGLSELKKDYDKGTFNQESE